MEHQQILDRSPATTGFVAVAAAVLRRRAEIEESDDPASLQEVKAITGRYIAAHDVDAYVSSWWPNFKAVVRIHADIVGGWNRGY